MSQTDFDVGIIGGGPAGSSMAAYLAKAGINCVVFERELFPRPHVGESLVPSSTRVFKDLDFLRVMEENKFPRKYGAVWTAAQVSPAFSVRRSAPPPGWSPRNTTARADRSPDPRRLSATSPGCGRRWNSRARC